MLNNDDRYSFELWARVVAGIFGTILTLLILIKMACILFPKRYEYKPTPEPVVQIEEEKSSCEVNAKNINTVCSTWGAKSFQTDEKTGCIINVICK